jgi:hypothetical protein
VQSESFWSRCWCFVVGGKHPQIILALDEPHERRFTLWRHLSDFLYSEWIMWGNNRSPALECPLVFSFPRCVTSCTSS